MHSTDRVQEAHSAYVTEVTNEDPLTLIAQVYRFAHVQARRARSAIEQGNQQAKAKAIHRLLRALSLLHGSVNMSEGGEVAANLDRLYTYFVQRISTANLRNDSAAVLEVEGYLGELAEVWALVSERGAASSAP